MEILLRPVLHKHNYNPVYLHGSNTNEYVSIRYYNKMSLVS
jgi:hypothetical protein